MPAKKKRDYLNTGAMGKGGRTFRDRPTTKPLGEAANRRPDAYYKGLRTTWADS
jgi:hypothetical protein